MALTEFQRGVCRLLAENRIRSGESYVALFHDTEQALAASWQADRTTLEAPQAAELSHRWHDALDAAREVVALLPAREAGRAVMIREGGLFSGEPDALRAAIQGNVLVYDEGSIGGAFPRIVPNR